MKISQSAVLSPTERRLREPLNPEPMDYVRLGGCSENHITVGRLLENSGNGRWVIEDCYGEVYIVGRAPEFDTQMILGWQVL